MPNNIFLYNNFFCNVVEPEVRRAEQRYAPLKCVLDVCRTKINRLDVRNFWPWDSEFMSANKMLEEKAKLFTKENDAKPEHKSSIQLEDR